MTVPSALRKVFFLIFWPFAAGRSFFVIASQLNEKARPKHHCPCDEGAVQCPQTTEYSSLPTRCKGIPVVESQRFAIECSAVMGDGSWKNWVKVPNYRYDGPGFPNQTEDT